jgi:hypothetical protein
MTDGPQDQTCEIVYTGPASRAGFVAQILREEGLEVVSWTPPEEQRCLETVVDAVTVVYVVKGIDAVGRAIAKARERLRGRGIIRRKVDDDSE